MSPTLNGSSALEDFERSNAIELRNGIVFNFYPGLPHVHIVAHIVALFPIHYSFPACSMSSIPGN